MSRVPSKYDIKKFIFAKGVPMHFRLSNSKTFKLRLPAIFGNHMVLQRGQVIPIWGLSAPTAYVTVSFHGDTASAMADIQGNWAMELGPYPEGGPYTMTVESGNTKIEFKDVLIGEVWLASGQSNMEMSLNSVQNGYEETQNANFPQIRLFQTPLVADSEPQFTCGGSWTLCSPATAAGFSAVAYFFGRELHQRYNVPIGLIESAWGGTPAESWTSLEVLEENPVFESILERVPDPDEDLPAKMQEWEVAHKLWEQEARLKDPGDKGYPLGFAQPDFDDSNWETMTLPGPFDTNTPQLLIDGAVWFRTKVSIPREWEGESLALSLGAIDDFDSTYYDNVQVGATGLETPNSWMTPRHYTIHGKLVHAGEATIAVRVFDEAAQGGFTGHPDDMYLTLDDGGDRISLAGEWRFYVEYSRNHSDVPPEPPCPGWNSWTPSGLYNAMINPLIPYAIKGAIWYQGESNADRAYQYRTLFPTMITNWRDDWEQGDFPFYWVQLANFGASNADPVESDWAELREAQSMTLDLPNTGQAVTIDIGDTVDIHPKNKQDVGKRLALIAMAQAYGEDDIVCSGPAYHTMKVEGNKATIYFTHADGGLSVNDGRPVTGFAIAGKDRIFHWAQAEISGEQVIVSCEKVPNPIAVRYGWSGNPEVNLYNRSGLPASPFRTDDWKGVTYGKR